LAENNVKKGARHAAPERGTTSAPVDSPGDVMLALVPLDAPLVIGHRGLAEFLADLAVATDDLSS
jgi:hypothetical protein